MPGAPPGDGIGAAAGVYVAAVALAGVLLLRQGRTILENRRLYARLDAAYALQGQRLALRVAHLEWVRDVTRQVNAARSLRQVLDAAYEGIRAGLGYDRVGINLWDYEAGIFEECIGTDAEGRKTWPTDRSLRLTPDSPLWRSPGMAAMLRGDELYYTARSYAETPRELRFLHDGASAHNLMISLRGGDRVVGMISVDNLTSGRPIVEADAAPLLALANQVGLALERARLTEALQARAEEAEAMARVSAALSSTLEPESLYELIFQHLSRVLPCDHLAVVLYQDGWLTLVAHWGAPCVAVPARLMTLEEATLAYKTAASAPIYLDDTAATPSWRDLPPWVGEHRLRSVIAIPLLIEGAVRGSFNVASFTPRTYTAQQVQIALAFGERIAQALRNAQLYVAEQERARAAEELARLREQQAEETAALTLASAALAGAMEPAALYRCILEQVASAMPCANACVWLFDGDWISVGATWGTPALPVGTRVFARDQESQRLWPALHAAPVYIAETRDDPDWIDNEPWIGEHAVRSIIKVPLGIGGELVGCFDIASTLPHAYTARDLRVASAFGERAELALRNAQLYVAEQQRARAAEDLARLRSDFVASVSHELRTPLTAIVGYGELLEHRWAQLDDPARLASVRKIVASANRQQRLVEELLLLSRVEARSVTVAQVVSPLTELVRRAVDEVQASYRGQRVSIEGPADIAVLVDPDRVIQILVNLLDNAAKYSPEGAAIEVRCSEADGAVQVLVRDFGRGLPERGQEALFTRFGRLPGSQARAGRVGTGLGLYLSRQLAALMGGALDLEHTGPEGSTFSLRLPGSRLDPPRGTALGAPDADLPSPRPASPPHGHPGPSHTGG